MILVLLGTQNNSFTRLLEAVQENIDKKIINDEVVVQAGFTDQEREKFQLLLDAGFIDTFRHFYPTQENIYSWWSYRFKTREKNAGWRIDYFLASSRIADKLQDAKIHTEIFGSDHCPVEVTINW